LSRAASGVLGFRVHTLDNNDTKGMGMFKRTAAPARVAAWADRKQDFLMVSAFGMWAAVLGLSPVLLFRALS